MLDPTRTTFGSLLLLLTTVQAVPTHDCPILGTALPGGFDIESSSSFRNGTAQFAEGIERLFASETLNRTHSVFYIDVYSTRTNSSIYNYAYNGSEMHQYLTTGQLDDETIFRTGSVSKLFTAYSILAHYGNLSVLEHPVTRYLSELSGNAPNDLNTITWEDMTVGALMSMQGGTGGAPLDIFEICQPAQSGNCAISGYLDLMKIKRPVVDIFSTGMYSDAGYTMLGRVLERMTNLTYSEALQNVLCDSIGLNSTSSFAALSENLNALVMPGEPGLESSWGADNQLAAPSGGFYSSSADLRALGLSIIHNQFLSATQTRHWMKPLAHTASLGSQHTKVSDVYTKAGGNLGYAAIAGLSPDHDIGYTILVAGDWATLERWPLHTLIGETIITAAEWARSDNAAITWAGTYAASEIDNMTLTVDGNRPGLGISSFFVNGTEWRNLMAFPPGAIPTEDVSARLYPIGRHNSTYMAFRAVVTREGVGSICGIT